MNRNTVIAAIVAALLSMPGQAQKTSRAEVLFESARQKETLEGDLKGAIELYRKAAAEAGKDRATGAQALLHLAQCYEKQGNAEARGIYERLVREYADQKGAVATARARLGGTNFASSAKGDRAVWTGRRVNSSGRVSPDGRFVSFIDWSTGSLMVHDVAENMDHPLTPPLPQSNSWGTSVFSGDGKQLIYAWSENNRRSIRIAQFQGSRILEPRQLFLADEDVRFMGPQDWSPNRKWIAATMTRRDGTSQIVLIAVADGSLRVLKSMDWTMSTGSIFFSLDSKHIAYDLPATDAGQQRDVYVLAIDGSRETPAVVHPADEAVLGWSPDGRHLLFSSDRTGSAGLWALPFADGRPQGSPELLRSDIGSSSSSLGLTSSGALYLHKVIDGRDIRIAPVDLNSGRLLDAPASFVQGFLAGATNPNWSPDGRYLAYAACAGNCLVVRSVDTGQVRRLARTLPYVTPPKWAPDGSSLLAAGRDPKGRDGVYQIDLQSGSASPIVYTTSLGADPRWSPDGRKIYYVKRAAPPSILERDLASGAEREVIRRPGMWTEVNLSPDGRYLAVQTGAFALTMERTLLLVPVAGGEPRELLRLKDPDQWGRMGTTSWTPDGKAILKVKRTASGTELLLIPIDGTPVRKLDINPEVWTRGADEAGPDQGFSLSPDGRKIAFLMGKSAAEVWALENFLPAQSARR